MSNPKQDDRTESPRALGRTEDDSSGVAFAIVREGHSVPICRVARKLPKRYEAPPKVGLVIGTFAAVPYIHLQLEARRRLYPDVPVLVHDDFSPKRDTLAALCRKYAVDFETTNVRMPPCKGDLSAFLGGLAWCRERGIDLLVKMSRRFVPQIPWAEALADLAFESDYPTFSSWTTTFGFGFRTECLALAVKDWTGISDEIIDAIHAPGTPFVEGFMHNLARRLASCRTLGMVQFDARIGQRPVNRNGYAPWPFIGTDRRARSSDHLWHDSDVAADYAGLARQWGLDYQARDFADPNMGFGARPSSVIPAAGAKSAVARPSPAIAGEKSGDDTQRPEPTAASHAHILFQITIGNESPEQLECCLRNFREFYPESTVIVLSEGCSDPAAERITKNYRAVYVPGQMLEGRDRESSWWHRFFVEALNYSGDYIMRLDVRTRIWRRFSIPEQGQFFGCLIYEGTPEEHIHGGCQGFSRRFAESVVAAGSGIEGQGAGAENGGGSGRGAAKDPAPAATLAERPSSPPAFDAHRAPLQMDAHRAAPQHPECRAPLDPGPPKNVPGGDRRRAAMVPTAGTIFPALDRRIKEAAMQLGYRWKHHSEFSSKAASGRPPNEDRYAVTR